MQDDIKKIADHYGYEAQSRQLIEEMAELTMAICKYARLDVKKVSVSELLDSYGNIVEEIADVEIMLSQIKYLMACEDGIEQEKARKIQRQLKRMESED